MIAFVLAATVVALLIYKAIVQPLTYWWRLNIPSLPPMPILGNAWKVFLRRESFCDFVDMLHKTTTSKIIGIHLLNIPILFVKDVDVIRLVTLKHFDNFVNHSLVLFNVQWHPAVKQNLFNLNDEKWRKLRLTLTPAFTGNKIRLMIPLIQESVDNFTNYLRAGINPQTNQVDIDGKDVVSRVTSDVITNVAFGISNNSFGDGPNEVYEMGKRMVEMKFWKMAMTYLFGAEFLQKYFNFTTVSPEALAFFVNLFRQSLKFRKEQGIVRLDMIHLMMEAQKQGMDNLQKDPNTFVLTEAQMISQCFLFFFAGYDSVSTVLSYTLLELSINPDVQKKLYDEVMSVCPDGQVLDYKKLSSMKYLDMVLAEANRKWPTVPAIDRKCTKDTILDVDGRQIKIRKGEILFYSIYGTHRDPNVWPEPDVFDPERFNDENSNGRHPGAFLGFGSGPRHCIAMRLGLLEMKIVVANVIRQFEVVPNEKTLPIVHNREVFLAWPRSAHVGLRKRQ